MPPLSPFPPCADPPLEFQSHPNGKIYSFIQLLLTRRRFEWVIGETAPGNKEK
jgi:hypothetical protein